MLTKKFIKTCVKKSKCKLREVHKLTNNWRVYSINQKIQNERAIVNNIYCAECESFIVKYGRDSVVKSRGKDI